MLSSLSLFLVGFQLANLNFRSNKGLSKKDLTASNGISYGLYLWGFFSCENNFSFENL